MGIRFICPECEKRIHVKSFLAGKRGICPKCGGKVQIPTESENSQSAGESGPPVPPGGYASVGAPYAHAGANPTTATPVGSGPLPTAPLPGIGPRPVTSPAVAPATNGNGHSAPTAGAPIVGPQPVAQPQPQATPQPADPIAESPNSKWYVRPQSGGQFGPAAGEVMRRWLDEGRVNPDSLVWREGWDDWKKASLVFPSMGAVPSGPTAPAPPSTENEFAVPKASTGAGVYRGRRKSSNGMVIGVVLGLAVVILGLLAALVIVLNQSG